MRAQLLIELAQAKAHLAAERAAARQVPIAQIIYCARYVESIFGQNNDSDAIRAWLKIDLDDWLNIQVQRPTVTASHRPYPEVFAELRQKYGHYFDNWPEVEP